MNGLELRRRAMISATKQEGLPSKYQEVEYLENSGTQYLFTKYTPNINSTFYWKFAITGTLNAQNGMFGFFYQGSGNRVSAYHTNDGRWFAGCGKKQYRINKGISVGETYEATISSEHLIIGGSSFNPASDYTSSGWYPISLFAINSTTHNTYTHPCLRLYRFTGYEQGRTTCDFVPCYRKSDNKPGMYDLVSRRFYTNLGTGEFTVGSDVN